MRKDSLIKRQYADKKYTWKLEHMYASDEAWEEHYKKTSEEIEKLKEFKGKLSKSSNELLKCLESNDNAAMSAEKLYCYSNMKFHEDSGNSFYQSMSNKAEMLIVKYSETSAFITPEVLGIDYDKLNGFMSENDGLKKYNHFIENIIRRKEHTLSEREEALIAKTEEMSSSAQNIFTMINDADIKFPNIKDENGNSVELTKGRYVSFLESSNREVRKAAFDSLYNTYLKQKNTIAATYYASVKNDVFYANVRNYKSAMSMALDDDKIPEEVYESLLDTVHKNIGLLHRYIDIRKKLLGVDELHMYDLYTPLVPECDVEISYDEAKVKVAEGLSPMGDEYISILKEGFEGGWIDVYENEGKRGGAYSWGTYPYHPYVLLNHNDNINSMFTLAHEMGHALHSYYTWKTQPYIYSGHKIFVAEVASTVNEALLMEHLLKTTSDKKQRLYLINYFCEQFRGTLFRQTMFAEFEKITHEMVERGEPLTVESLNKVYRDLNKFYFGQNIVIDDRIDIEWARIPHFYNAFYVYQYATGYSAAITLSRKILNEGKSAVDKYVDFLKKGNSEYSIELLKGAGVDMTQSVAFDTAMNVFSSLLDELEKM